MVGPDGAGAVRGAQGRVGGRPVVLDEAQRTAVEHRGGVLRVLGAPGTGKSATAVAVVAARVRAGELAADQCLLIGPTRVAAAALRDAVTAAVGGTSTTPMARTLASFAFGILRQEAALHGDPAPRLLSGPEQDIILRDLLAGHAAGEGADPGWPERVRPALGTRGFRTELRDLLMRAVEHGVGPEQLAELGRRRERPEWVAGARVLAEYDAVTALSAPGAYDPAWILGAAADLLEDDEAAMARVRDGVRLVVVDDAQELTPAAARLLRALCGPGVDVILLGDPDAAVQTFRGGDPRWLASAWTVLGEGPTVVLPTAYRLPSAMLDVAARVTGHIGVLGEAGHRRAAAGREGGVVEAHLLRSAAQEAAFVAGRFREAHLAEGVPWAQMAVVVRGNGRTATLRRVLAAEGVPVNATAADLPVREETAVRPLLTLMAAALAVASGQAQAYDPEVIVDAILSPIGGADAVSLRRLRRALRRHELADGGGRPSDELLAEAVRFPLVLSELGPEALPARRIARVLQAGVDAAEVDAERGGWARGVTAESVLWAMWSASGLSSVWRDVALGGGQAGARRDRDLDAVVALFDAAARFVDRLPASGPDAFLEHLRSQDVAGDSLVARAPAGDAVSVLTPAAAAGRQWRFVVVAGVQEGVWPDLRLRGSLLGSAELVDVLTGRAGSWRAAQAAVRHDETRLFHVAVTRASERLLVTAVGSDDEQPSPYLDVVAPRDDATDGEETGRPFSEVDRTMTLTSVVAALRRDLVSDSPSVRGGAVTALARLARAGVPGADPARWWALTAVSDGRPLRADDVTVRISPSQVESFGTCGLRWLLTTRGGERPAVGSKDVGTLVHEVAAEHDDTADAAVLREALDAKWGRLGLPPGWVTDRKHADAGRMVERLATYFDKAEEQGWTRVGAEVEMRVAMGRAELRGRVDRVERDAGGRLRVIDYKTGSSKPTVAQMPRHPQLGCYQVAVEDGAFADLGTTSAGAGLLQLGKAATRALDPQLQRPMADDDEPTWGRALVHDTAVGMAAATVTATVGSHCQFCPVLTSCPAKPEGRSL